MLSKPAVSASRNIVDIVMEQTSENALLNWDVFVTPGIPIVTRDLPPGVREADFDRLTGTTTTVQELYDKVLELYPNRINPGWALWRSTRAVKS